MTVETDKGGRAWWTYRAARRNEARKRRLIWRELPRSRAVGPGLRVVLPEPVTLEDKLARYGRS